MIVTAHQPHYLPWLGYFDKIARADVFVISDDVQFSPRDYVHRNWVKTANGPRRLTVPIAKGSSRQLIRETVIAAHQPWEATHLATIRSAYARAPFFEARYEELCELYAGCRRAGVRTIDELCVVQLAYWLDLLDLTVRIVRGSQLDVAGEVKSARLLRICQQLEATAYLSGPHGRDYLDEAAFDSAGIRVLYQDFKHPTYGQLHGDFVPAMSVVDVAMNVQYPGCVLAT